MLTPRAVIGTTPGLANLFDHAVTPQTGFAGAVVNSGLNLETPGPAIAMYIIPNAAAAGGDGVRQRFADGRHQDSIAIPTNPVRCPQRRNPSPEKALRSIDVANPDHQMTIHQGRLDRTAAARQGGMEPVDGKPVGKRLETLRGQQGVLLGLDRRPRLPQNDAKATRIGKTQYLAGKDQIEMIVLLRRQIVRHKAQVARHAQMNDQAALDAATSAINQQVLGAPPHGNNLAPRQQIDQEPGNLVAQPRHPDHHAPHDLPDQFRRDTATTDFNLRQLRHCLFLRANPNNIAKLIGFYAFQAPDSHQLDRKPSMSSKFLVAALTLALGLTHSGLGLAAGDPPARSGNKRAAPSASSEDVLARTVFQALVGEFALQRGDPKLGSDAWSDLAVRTRDPKVIARATEIAGFARQYDRALELSKLWLEIEPDSAKARQTQSSLLVMANRLDDLAPQLAALLEQDKPNVGNNLLHLNRMLGKINDKKAVQSLIDKVAAPYDTLPEAHFAMAQAAANAGDNLRALIETEKSLQLRPGWETAAIARAQLQARQSAKTAIDSLDEFVSRNPNANDARLTLARLLISEKRYDESRRHFDRLITANPNNPDVIYPVAMLALQQGDTITGRSQLEHLLQTDFPDKNTIHFFIGQLDQEQKNPDAALSHYRQVNAGEQYVPARSRAAQILAQQGKLDEARTLLRDTRGGTPAERTQLALAESQLLREAGRHNDAYIVLDAALTAQPNDLELLYEAALTAERLGKPELLEAHLKRLLALKPDHAHALNALGYSLAERNVRLTEAQDLITRALALSPEDPFIMDSMGWVLYRQGKLVEARQTLERAYRIKADPEIAAHLGEVLWTLDRKDEARRILRDAVKAYPDNEVLTGTVKKLLP